MKYYANFSANGGRTYNARPYEGTDKAKLIGEIRAIAEGNMFPGGRCAWCVETEDGLEVAAGGVLNGRRYRTI